MPLPFQSRIKSHQYGLAPTSEDGEIPSLPHTSKRQSFGRLVLCLVITSLVSSVVSFGIFYLIFVRTSETQCPKPAIEQEPSIPQVVNNISCGLTPSEARVNGCKFDLLFAAWTPPMCFDSEGSAEYSTEGWPYYADAGGLQELPLDQVAAGTRSEFYTTQGAYLSYCLHSWLRLHRLVVTGGHLDSVLGSSLKPTYDCINFFREVEWNAKQGEMAKIGSAQDVSFRSCD